MASKWQALILILLSLLALKSSEASSSNGIAIYWGQNNGDQSLTSTCDTGNYKIVLIAFLNEFGCGKTPKWNLAGHCGDWSPCTKLQPEIQHCQQNGIKVFLSLGGGVGDYSLCSPQDAKDVATYLYNNFLTGQFGPFGSVSLDGIDFDIESNTFDYWDNLARELDTLRQKNKYFYLSAAPQCVMPDRHLDTAIKTGVFNYIFVQFYNNPPCQYDTVNHDATLLLQSWNAWTLFVMPNNTVFMGLPAALDAAPSGGYIPPDELNSKVLPFIKETFNYGEIMLWDRYRDIQNNYSNQIKGYVLNNVLWFVKAVSDAISEWVSAAGLNHMLLKLY